MQLHESHAPTPREQAQWQATDPAVCAWVTANAGAGKTRLLVDRVLRLLLAGTAPHRILCITYTKAGASEMEHRIASEISRWAVAEEAELERALHALSGRPPAEAERKEARTLFARLADAPEGLRIQTIHAFCQSLLARFPLESGIAPHFTALDEIDAAELLRESLQALYAAAARAPEGPLAAALRALAAHVSEAALHKALHEAMKERRSLRALFTHEDTSQHTHALREFLGVPAHATEEALRREIFSYTPQRMRGLQAIAETLSACEEKTNRETAQGVRAFFPECADVSAYLRVYLTKENAPRQKPPTRGPAV